MATKVVKVSDLTGQQIEDEQSGARLVVEHPGFPEPIGLDVLPDEVLPHLTEQLKRFVVVSYLSSEGGDPDRYVLPVDEFESLFRVEDSTIVLQNALEAQRQEVVSHPRRQSRSAGAGTRTRIDYTSPDHAGEPHRGTISEAEKEYVKNHLDEVNARLREQGKRQIDPNDPNMAERYGLTPAAD
jgi:hypothetical protein